MTDLRSIVDDITTHVRNDSNSYPRLVSESGSGNGTSWTIVAPSSFPYAASAGEMVLVDPSSDKTVNLPAATVGMMIRVKLTTNNPGPHTVTVNPNSATIDGDPSVPLTGPYEWVDLIATSSSTWAIVG